MRRKAQRLLIALVLLAPTVLLAGGRGAEPPIPDPVQGDPAGFLTRFLELVREFVAGLVGSMGV